MGKIRYSLSGMAKRALWPGELDALARRMLPTPCSRDHKDSRPNVNWAKVKAKHKLAGFAGGALNPTWVGWLMGFPLGWTDSAPLETESFQQWLLAHGQSYSSEP